MKSVLTKATNPTISAHLFPYAFINLNQSARAEFWAVLGEYRSKEKVGAWRAFVNLRCQMFVIAYLVLT